MKDYPFPIDAVFVWVDGQDPLWQQRRQEASAQEGLTEKVLANGAVTPALSRENDELRYALRSLATHAPWINRVHLVVDKQCPVWLDTTQVHLVELEDILPDGAYPSFNSHTIELCLHRVPGIAEHFISFNDDFMLGASVHPQDFFFPDGKPKVWVTVKKGKKPLHSDYTGLSLRRKFEAHTRDAIWKKYGIYYPHKVKHHPRTHTVQSMKELWEHLPEETTTTLHSRFRSENDFMTPLGYALFLLAEKKGHPDPINGLAQIGHFFQGRVRHIGASLGDKNTTTKMRAISFCKPLTFCINDAPSADEQDRNMLYTFLRMQFPEPSRFEKADSAPPPSHR